MAARARIPVDVDDAVRALPHFDPDLDGEPPADVRRFRAACAGAGGVVLAVPEYAFGIPGSFKNALDWTVGSGGLYRKPVALLSVAPPGRGAQVRHALDAVLRALDADVTHHSVPVLPDDRDALGEIAEPRVIDALRSVVECLAARARAVRERTE